jgi:hypothetical protein
MSSPTESIPTASQRRTHHLAVNSYERAASLLVSLLIMVGVTVGGLLIVFFAREVILSEIAIPVQPVALGGGRAPNTPLGFARDIEPPGEEDAPELDEPQLQETLALVTESFSPNGAVLSEDIVGNAATSGRGSGLGDSREVGTGGPGEAVREPDRELKFKPDTIAQYAQYLDNFKMELGVFGSPDGEVHYAYNFSKTQPDVRTAKPPDNRLRFLSAGTPLEGLDRQLVNKAGIGRRGRYIAQFCSPEMEQLLLRLEQQQAGTRQRDQIRRTVFRVTVQGNAFNINVESQTYR